MADRCKLLSLVFVCDNASANLRMVANVRREAPQNTLAWPSIWVGGVMWVANAGGHAGFFKPNGSQQKNLFFQMIRFNQFSTLVATYYSDLEFKHGFWSVD